MERELIGQTYGRLTIKSVYRDKKKNVRCTCDCKCGNTHDVQLNNLKNGNVKSCGCLSQEWSASGNARRIHGARGTRLYNIWKSMRERCNTKTASNYHKYGGRGISVCEEWASFIPFRDWALGNGYAETLTLDRINSNGNYEPSNCRWATYKEQANNTKSNIRYTFNGKSKTIGEWSSVVGVPYGTLWNRIKVRKWPLERALTEPLSRNTNRGEPCQRECTM